MALLTLGAPLLAGFNGRPLPPLGSVPAGTRLPPLAGRDRLTPYALTAAGAVPAERVGSAMMRGLAGADGVAVVPAEGAAAGDRLRTLPLPW
jgi:molybdopterin molybdotransferase